MIISVTGATGFIGSHLVDRLLTQGHRIRVLVRGSSNLRWLKNKEIQFFEGDARNLYSLEPFIRDADCIYHVAAVTKARTVQEYFEGNDLATRNILEATQAYAPNLTRFIHVSSQTVTGPAESLNSPVNELTPCNPITTYAKSKLAAEKAVESFTGRIPWTIVRPSAVYGPRDTEIFVYFQTIFNRLNTIIGFNDKRLNLIHSDDLVDGILMAATSEQSVGEIYFISSEEFYSWHQIGDAASKAIGRRFFNIRIPHFVVYLAAVIAQTVSSLQAKPATLNLEKARDLTQQYWICDPSKAKKDLGFRQKISLEEGFCETVKWYREQKWLK